jgi:hypothetical protein
MTSTNTTNDRLLTGFFDDRDDADRAYADLRREGFGEDQISVMMSQDTRDTHYSNDRDDNDRKVGTAHTEMGTKATEGAGVGGAVGGTIGGVLGAISAAAAPIVFPGIGIALSGPLAAGLAGAGAGGLGGSLLGGLVGAGIPEERVERYESGLKEGGILLGVHPRTDAEATRVANVFRTYNAD